MNNKRKLSVKELVIISVLCCILFVQKQVLSFIPYIQLTVFCIVLYSKKLGFKKTVLIVAVYTILDNIIYGFNPLLFSFMLLGWLIIPLLLCTMFKSVKTNIGLAFFGFFISFIYSWILIYPSMIIMEISFTDYLMADIIWEISIATSSFLSILWFYNPLKKLLDTLC